MAKLNLDKALIRELTLLLEETGLSEIEVEENGRRIRVARNAVTVNAVPATAAEAPEAAAVGEGASPAATEASHPGAVTSPMVGTVYLSAEPGALPFVTAGANVTQGQTLFIVEAMKTMNPIPAPRDGTVSRILIANGAPVEYGEVLLILE